MSCAVPWIAKLGGDRRDALPEHHRVADRRPVGGVVARDGAVEVQGRREDVAPVAPGQQVVAVPSAEHIVRLSPLITSTPSAPNALDARQPLDPVPAGVHARFWNRRSTVRASPA